MATKLFLRNTTTNGVTGTGDSIVYDMVTAAGSSSDTAVVNTVASGTQIQLTKTAGGSSIAWVSGRAPAGGFTLTSTDISLWFLESNMNANAGGRYRVYKLSSGGTLTELGGGPFDDGVEFGTSSTEMTWTGNVTDTAFAENDRILLRVYITNVGTMASGHTCTLTFNAADASTGDSFYNIAETVTFKTEPQIVSGVGGIASATAFGTSRTVMFARPQGIPAPDSTTLASELINFWKLDESSGSRGDSVGTSTLTDNNTVTQASGRVGNAAEFIAANSEYLSCADNAELSAGSASFSFAAWVYFYSLDDARGILGKGDEGSGNEYALYYSVGNGRFQADIVGAGGTTGGYYTGVSASINTWYFVVFSYDHVTNEVVLSVNNGTEQRYSCGGIVPRDGTASFYIGKNPLIGTNNRMWGLIDAVGHWRRVLNSADRAALYNSGNGVEYPFGATTNMGTPRVNHVLNVTGAGNVASAEAFGGSSKLNMQVRPTGVTSAESFGTTTVARGAVTVVPSGIASAQAFGTSSLRRFIQATAIASAEAFGNASMLRGTVTVAPTGIASAEAFGAQRLNLKLSPTGVVSAEAFGTSKLNVKVQPSGISSAEAFGTSTVQRGAVVVAPSSVPSAEAFGTSKLNRHLVSAGVPSAEVFGGARLNLTLMLAGIASGEAFGTSKVNRAVVPSGIASAESFGSAVVQAGGSFISTTGIPSAESIGSPALNLYVRSSGIASAEAFGTSRLNLALRFNGIASAEGFGTASLVRIITPMGIGSAESFGSASVLRGAVTLLPTGIPTGEAFGAARVNQLLRLAGIASAESFGSVTLHTSATVAASGIASAEAYGTARLNRLLALAGIPSAEAFGSPAFSVGPVYIQLSGIASLEAFGTLTVQRGAVTIALSGIPSAEAFGVTQLLQNYRLQVTSITSQESFGTPAVVVHAALISPTGIPSGEAFGTLKVLISGIKATTLLTNFALVQTVLTNMLLTTDEVTNQSRVATALRNSTTTAAEEGHAALVKTILSQE